MSATGPSTLTMPGDARKPKKSYLKWSVWGIVALLLLVVMGSCLQTLLKDGAASDLEVAKFHKALGEGNCESIYKTSAPEFQNAITTADWQVMCAGISKRMGAHSKSSRRQIAFNNNAQGKFATITYESEFALGKASETFNWKWEGDHLLMTGYRINSPNFDKPLTDK